MRAQVEVLPVAVLAAAEVNARELALGLEGDVVLDRAGAEVGAAQHGAALVNAQRRLAEEGREADVAAVELPVRGVERGGDELGVSAAGAGGQAQGREKEQEAAHRSISRRA